MDRIGLRHPHPFVKTIISALHGQICMKGVVEVVVVGTKTPFWGNHSTFQEKGVFQGVMTLMLVEGVNL